MISAAILALLAAAPMQSYDGYRSWLAACDNTLTCQAKGFGDGDKRAEMRIDRAAGPDGALSATIGTETRFTLAQVAVDGRPLALRSADWTVESGEDGTTLTTTRPAAVHALIARIRNGAVLTLGIGASVPLDGLVAALLRVDERQDRRGDGALVRTGGARASRAAPPLPRIPHRPVRARLGAGEAARLIARVRSGQRAVFAAEDCQSDISSAEPQAFALGDAQALVLIPCLAGAYQGSSLGFIASRKGGAARRLIAPMRYAGNDPDARDADMFTEGDFDPDTGMLAMFAKGRGLADCGIAASWIWNGAEFRLAGLSLQQACGGTRPGDWPTLFRSVQ